MRYVDETPYIMEAFADIMYVFRRFIGMLNAWKAYSSLFLIYL